MSRFGQHTVVDGLDPSRVLPAAPQQQPLRRRPTQIAARTGAAATLSTGSALETARLHLRPWNLAQDLAAFSAICADPEVMRYIGDGHVWTMAESRSWIETNLEAMVRSTDRTHTEPVFSCNLECTETCWEMINRSQRRGAHDARLRTAFVSGRWRGRRRESC